MSKEQTAEYYEKALRKALPGARIRVKSVVEIDYQGETLSMISPSIPDAVARLVQIAQLYMPGFNQIDHGDYISKRVA